MQISFPFPLHPILILQPELKPNFPSLFQISCKLSNLYYQAPIFTQIIQKTLIIGKLRIISQHKNGCSWLNQIPRSSWSEWDSHLTMTHSHKANFSTCTSGTQCCWHGFVEACTIKTHIDSTFHSFMYLWYFFSNIL